MEKLRKELECGLIHYIPKAEIHGSGVMRLPNTTSIYIPSRDAAQIVNHAGIHGLCISAGAACSSGGEPSHVLRAMGFSTNHANSTVRLSLSRWTSAEQIRSATQILVRIYKSQPDSHSVYTRTSRRFQTQQ
jgi:cysteine desulfurase